MLAWCTLAAPARGQVGSAGDPYRVAVATVPSSYWGYTFTPYAANLHASAVMVEAQGDFLIKTQEAKLLREKVRLAKLETRRAELEHWVWEREFLAAARERERQIIHDKEVERARTLPPITEILSATSLNNLLDEMITKPSLSPSVSTPVQEEWLEPVHTTVNGRGNAGLLKNDRLFWPQLLSQSLFAKDREQIELCFARAKKEASLSQRDPENLHKLRRHVADCQARMRDELRKGDDFTWSPRHYIEAKRLMQQMEDAIALLERPDAGYFLSPLQGKTVAELVAYMKKEGVRFAPATIGCERAYVALHRALADEATQQKAQR